MTVGSAVRVKTIYGEVEGICDGKLNRWLGIPFAQPPLGDLRFKRSHPPQPWKGIKNCTEFASRPYQYMGVETTEPSEGEDCLYLNIWAPKNATKLPVFFWIYGGAYHYGFASDPAYDGSNMASKDVIFVNFNYRVGPLGYYNFSHYDDSFESNCALSDQVAALQWVKQNIFAFGGDPDNITIAGESAGGTAVYDLLACPSAKGLFRKAIAQSGLPQAHGSAYTQKLYTDLFLDKLHVSPKNIARLRTMPAVEMKPAAMWTLYNFSKTFPAMMTCGPVIGDDLLPIFPWEALQKGSAEGVDVIFGFNRDEGAAFIRPKENMYFCKWAQVEQMMKMNKKEALLPEMKTIYSKYPKEKAKLAAILRDQAFITNQIGCADAQTQHGKVWVYRYDFAPFLLKIAGLGAMHGVEISFALGNVGKGLFDMLFKGTPRKKLDELAAQMNGAWLCFAKTGNPGDNWPHYSADRRNLHLFDVQPSNIVEDMEELLKFWNKVGLLYTKESFL